MNSLDLVAAIRGGWPEKCDFCGRSYENGRYPEPEEAGAWSCNECQAEYYNKLKKENLNEH